MDYLQCSESSPCLRSPYLLTTFQVYANNDNDDHRTTVIDAFRYPSTIAQSLNADWAIAEVLLSSSYRGWGTGSLAKDARELAQCVEYFQNLRPGKMVVLMGHSTGCQDIMEYLVGKGMLLPRLLWSPRSVYSLSPACKLPFSMLVESSSRTQIRVQ